MLKFDRLSRSIQPFCELYKTPFWARLLMRHGLDDFMRTSGKTPLPR